MRRSETLDRLTEVSSDQGGYLTAAQAARLDIDRIRLADLVRSGDLRRVRRGVYATRGVQHPFEQEIAAWLAVETKTLPWEWREQQPRAILSHRSAAAIWDLGTIIPGLPALTVRSHPTRAGDIELHTARISRQDWTWHRLDGGVRVPLTTPARTIVDLGVAGEEPSYLERAVREGSQRGLASDEDLRAAAARRQRTGPALRALLSSLESAP